MTGEDVRIGWEIGSLRICSAASELASSEMRRDKKQKYTLVLDIEPKLSIYRSIKIYIIEPKKVRYFDNDNDKTTNDNRPNASHGDRGHGDKQHRTQRGTQS